MKQLKRFVSAALIFLFLLTLAPQSAWAKDLTVNISGGGQYSVGDTFTVNFSTVSDGGHVAQGVLTYDPAILSCSGASGSISFTSNSGAVVSSVGGGSVTFTCIATGNTTITATNVTGYDVATAEDLTPVVNAANVTVVPKETPKPLSSDASLTGLLTSLGPVNAADGSWILKCGHEVKDFAIAPECAPGAKWTATGAFDSLQVGENHFSIIVTAEDGVTQRTYPITVIRAAAPETSTPQTQPSSTPEETETSTEETTEEDFDGLLVGLVTGGDMQVIPSLEDVDLPAGYGVETYTYEGEEIEIAVNPAGVKLFYLCDENGENPYFYVYEESTKLCVPFVELAVDPLVFLPLPEDVKVPEGFEESTTTFVGQEIPCWEKEGEDFLLVYGRHGSSEPDFYRYEKDGTFQPYEEQEGAEDSEALEALQKENQKLAAKYEKDMQTRLILLIVLGVLCLILLVVVIVLLVTRRKDGSRPPKNPGNGGGDSYDYEEEELESWDPISEEEELPKVLLGSFDHEEQEEDFMEEEEEPAYSEQELLEEEPAEEQEAMEADAEAEAEWIIPVIPPIAEEEAGEEPETEELPEEEEEFDQDQFDKDMMDFEASLEELLSQSFPEKMEEWMQQEEFLDEEEELPLEMEAEELFEEEVLPEEDLFEEVDDLTVNGLYGETKVDGVDIEEDLDVYFSKKPEKKSSKKNKAKDGKKEKPAKPEPEDDGFEFIDF